MSSRLERQIVFGHAPMECLRVPFIEPRVGHAAVRVSDALRGRGTTGAVVAAPISPDDPAPAVNVIATTRRRGRRGREVSGGRTVASRRSPGRFQLFLSIASSDSFRSPPTAPRALAFKD